MLYAMSQDGTLYPIEEQAREQGEENPLDETWEEEQVREEQEKETGGADLLVMEVCSDRHDGDAIVISDTALVTPSEVYHITSLLTVGFAAGATVRSEGHFSALTIPVQGCP